MKHNIKVNFLPTLKKINGLASIHLHTLLYILYNTYVKVLYAPSLINIIKLEFNERFSCRFFSFFFFWLICVV